MASRDIHNQINPKFGIAPVVVTDNTVQKTGAIDTLGYESVEFLIITGTLSDADATFATVVKEGSTSTQSAHTAVATNDTIGTLANASFDFSADNVVRKIGYKGAQRYVSLEITPANNTGNAPLAVIVLLGNPKARPTTSVPN
jgi:hypothetical protein